MKIGFIGCGNMGGALLKAVFKSGASHELLVCDKNEERLMALEEKFSAKSMALSELGKSSDFIFLGVKPNGVEDVIASLSESDINKKAVLVSMAAGISVWHLRRFGWEGPIIRIMPNTPVSVGKGIVLYSLDEVSKAEEQQFLEILKKGGELIKFPEHLIDAGSALSGCGPAFCYMFIEALADGAVECGVPRGEAIRLAAGTLAGSAEMVLSTGEHPEALKDRVCSPGGSTIEGVHALERGAFRATVMDSVKKAFLKTKELSK